jgi:tRNA threonylcarbamoyladenosine biosynthesis protein TsaB
MTTILAIETSTELASAALLVDDQIYVRELSGVQTHSQGILPALQSLLSEAGIALSDCDVLAYGCGPVHLQEYAQLAALFRDLPMAQN